ncbi:SPW repeat domain-containing protein [Roseibium sp. SCP14]|uniref:SPW repeat domain-containing protein n=1 Tax=Roseibium sp. SCP14 TaxID=3141375 RepID=UPI00333C46E0
MNIRFVTKTIHAYLDYPVALGLIALPMLLNLGQSNPLAFWLSVTTGIAALILTVLTDHETGLIRVVPYSFHLVVDFAVGVVFLAAPFVLGFSGIDFAYYIVNALAVLTVVSLHKPEMAEAQAA